VTTTATRTKSTRSVNPKIAAKVAVFQATTEVEDGGPHLSQQERLVLATEVFNATSKALSDALQQNTLPKVPLQPTSPNRIITTPAKSKASKDTLATTANWEGGVIAVAECARLALSCLRSIKTQKPGENTYPNLQLEQGTCVLVGRLIALNLQDLAHKELRALKKRLQQYMEKASNDKPKKIDSTYDGRQENETEKETMAELLSFSHLENSKPLLGIIILFQTNALKLILAERKSSVLEKICNSLALSSPSSPANIIVNAVQAGSLTKDKAALQLLSLSNTVSSLSLLAQRSSSASSSTNPQKRPANTLVLQLLSLEIRTVSWTLSDHISDSKREFWDPLVRSLETFAVSNDGRLEKTDFATIYKSVQRLQSRMAKDQEKVSTDGMATISWKIAFALGKVAQDASCFEEALKLFSNAVNSPIGEQPLSFSSIRCRISFIHLHRQRSTKDYPTFMVSQSLLDAANGLKSSNRGTNSDLEELLMESAKLKKLAMACLGESLSFTESENELEEPTTGYLHAYIRFLRRYVGRPSTDDSSSKDSEQRQLVLKRSKNIILTAVDSTVALAKMSVLRQAPSWINVQPILSDCKRLLTALENLTDKESANDDHWRTSLVKLSNVYWSRYLKEKELGKDFAELIPLLEQATSILQNCPASDRAAGFAALKFERLSYLYSEARMGTKSATTLQRSIEEHIDSGTLHEFTRSLSGRPAHVLFHDVQNPGFTLSRVLSTYLKLQMRRRESAEQAIFDNRSLNLEERGILLEWQMGLLMETHQGCESDKESFRSLLQNVISLLLSLYPAQHYPTRRSRVVLHVLRFSLEHPHAIDSAVPDSLVKDFALNLSSDQDPTLETDLENFSIHVRNSLHLVLLFRDGSLNTENLQRILSSWASMIHKCPDWESVETFVDDPEYWISQLKAVADYMEARGLQHLHLTAIALLIRIMELQATKDISSIVLNLSRCALQYCRLGDCKGCLSLLDRAGYYTNNNDVSCYALVTYNLVLTEYFLEIGDQAKAENTLTDAQGIYESRLPETELNGRSKLSWERIVVDGTLLCSRIAHVKGSLRSALYFAKLSVRLSTRLWTKLERLSGKKRESEQIVKEQPEIDMLIDAVANIDIPGAAASPTWNYIEGAVFWPHVASHHACLLNLMRLSAHNGLFQDAIYYGEQALKATKSFGASVRSIACQTELGLEWIRGDRISDAKELLDAATILSKNQDNSIEIVALKASLAVLSKTQGHHDDVISLLQDAETSLAQLSRGQLGISFLLTNGPELGIEEKMANMKIRRTAVNKEADTATAHRPRRTKAPSKTASKTEQETETRPNSIESRSILLLKTEIIRQRAHSLLATQELDQALRLLNMAKEYSLPVKNQISLQIDEIEHILADAIRSVATHAVYCVLSESTLSLPSVECLKLICDSNADATKSSASKRPAPASKKQRAPVKETRSRAARVIKEDVNITGIMSNAKIAIAETVRNAAAFGSTVEGHAAASLMGRVSILLHAMAPGLVDQDVLTPANANGE
jgi:separase